MKKVWNSWLREAVFIYCVIYTVFTIMNSVLYLVQGVRDDPSGNWHELARATIVLIGIVAFEMAKHIPIKNMFVRAIVVYIPTMSLALLTVWSSHFIEPLAKSAYRDIFINYTSLFLIVSVIAIATTKIRKQRQEHK